MSEKEKQNAPEAETFRRSVKLLRVLLEETCDASLKSKKLLDESKKIRNRGIRILVKYYLNFYALPMLPRIIHGKRYKEGYKYPSLKSIKTVLGVGHNLAVDLRRTDNILQESLTMSRDWGDIIKMAFISQVLDKGDDDK
jgi:hypothetical protein